MLSIVCGSTHVWGEGKSKDGKAFDELFRK